MSSSFKLFLARKNTTTWTLAVLAAVGSLTLLYADRLDNHTSNTKQAYTLTCRYVHN